MYDKPRIDTDGPKRERKGMGKRERKRGRGGRERGKEGEGRREKKKNACFSFWGVWFPRTKFMTFKKFYGR